MPDRNAQPAAILADSEKALRLYKKADFDRFDDLCTTDFWVKMVEIMRGELVKAVEVQSPNVRHPNAGSGEYTVHESEQREGFGGLA